MNIRRLFVLILLPLTLFSPFGVAYAEETVIVIEGNGGSSSNEVHIEKKTTTKVEQKNETHVENDVEANANTGKNDTSHNNGDTATQTGDVKVETNIENSNINHNFADMPDCGCNEEANINVSGNGSGSMNTVNISTSNTNTTTQNNTANIHNNVVTNANTGKNNAVANTGDVFIKTGSINAATRIVNKDINISKAEDEGSQNSLNVSVSGNGAGSNNIVNVKDVNKTIYAAKNTANIYNSDVKNLNTGKNTADFNLGDVWVGTGDIVAVTEIINSGINVNDYTKTCDCEKPGGEVTPPPVIPPTNPPHHNGESRDNGDGNGGNGDVLGAANGEILPITGQLAYYFLTLSAIILFLAGWYLRFRSGLAPGTGIIA